MEKGKKDVSKWRVAIIGIGFVLGAALLLLGGNDKTAEKVKPDAAAEYRTELEAGLESLCRKMTGGEVEIFVSLEGGYSYTYALDSRGGVVTVGSGSSEKALVEDTFMPKISGVGVVCSGSVGSEVENSLTELISSALGVGKNKIFIIGSKKSAGGS